MALGYCPSPACAIVAIVTTRVPIGRLALLALASTSLMVSHELIYLLSHGLGTEYDHATTAGGHDDFSSTFLVIIGLVATMAVGVVLWQLRRLQALASRVRRSPAVVPGGDLSSLAGRAFAAWPRIALSVVGLFVLQENVELWLGGHAPMTVDMLLGDHVLALPVMAAVSLAAAFLRSLILWRRHVLRLRLRSVRAWTRSRPERRRAAVVVAPTSRYVLAANGLRAPPRGSLA